MWLFYPRYIGKTFLLQLSDNWNCFLLINCQMALQGNKMNKRELHIKFYFNNMLKLVPSPQATHTHTHFTLFCDIGWVSNSTNAHPKTGTHTKKTINHTRYKVCEWLFFSHIFFLNKIKLLFYFHNSGQNYPEHCLYSTSLGISFLTCSQRIFRI